MMVYFRVFWAFSSLSASSAVNPADPLPFDAPKYGVRAAIPAGWEVLVREREETVFAAAIPQADADRPGVAACEIGLAPESLDEYRTRLDANAKAGRRPGKLVRNEVARTPKGERLETAREFEPKGKGKWHELTYRVVAHRQLYTFTLNVDEATYPEARKLFDGLVDSTRLDPPNTGADRDPKARGANRWAQREFKFALDLPEGWAPALAPAEVALFFANGPAHGVWSDNCLVVARKHAAFDPEGLARTLPGRLKAVEPDCEVLACAVVKQGRRDALETVVRTRRGPFSMTVLERRFAGERFDYEVKFTVESERFDAVAPALRGCLDGFAELPGDVPGAPGRPA